MKLTLVKKAPFTSLERDTVLTEAQKQFQMRNLKKMIRFIKAQLKRLEKEGTID
ncbi:MAG: hypothetical protein J0H12_04015 [Candidatus Paracaedimonas acanthamoebae]|uniref:Uncharacterized protein n=1 Tax=Candidatus Paracaedimonas acanthamoebae TaxID=244581 RepID=A0A8J7TVJ3_9PROT|nr:hypothetical protein [Candidatus Paracaedimonas acanthamoebae]